MRFLADESCDFAVVRALREAGHDVAAVRELSLGVADDVVINLAVRENRILLTEDKDFGQLVYAHAANPPRHNFHPFSRKCPTGIGHGGHETRRHGRRENQRAFHRRSTGPHKSDVTAWNTSDTCGIRLIPGIETSNWPSRSIIRVSSVSDTIGG